MNTLIHADIFFFITTIAVVIISIGMITALIFVILILNNVRKVSETVRTETDLIAGDIDSIRSKMNKGVTTMAMGAIFGFFRNLFEKWSRGHK